MGVCICLGVCEPWRGGSSASPGSALRSRPRPAPRPRRPPPLPPPPAARRGAARLDGAGGGAGWLLRSSSRHPPPSFPPSPSLLVWGRVGAGSRLPGAGGDDFPVGICQVRVCAARRAPRLAPRVIYYLSPRRQRCGSGAAASNPRRRRGTSRGGSRAATGRPAGRERFSSRLAPPRPTLRPGCALGPFLPLSLPALLSLRGSRLSGAAGVGVSGSICCPARERQQGKGFFFLKAGW